MSDDICQARLIAVDLEPIPGTHLYRRWQNEEPIQPEYLGPALNELAAIEEASQHGFNAVAFAGSSYVRIGGTWYLLNLPVRNGSY